MKREKFIKPNPGINYKDGKLFIFEEDRVIVVKIDDYGPVAWKKSVEKPYFTNCSVPDSIGYLSTDAIINPPPEGEYIHWRVQEVMKFIEAHVPHVIIEQMARFRHSGAQWQICSLAMRTDGLDLIRTNPAIAYIVALNNVFMGKCRKPWRRARSLVFKKRTDILKKAGFPGNKSSVKILSKIPPEQLSIPLIFKMKTLLNSGNKDILNLLRFLPAFNLPLLRLLGNDDMRPYLGFSLLEAIAERKQTMPILEPPFSLIYDVFRMLCVMEIAPPAKIRSVEDLENSHYLLCEMLNADSEIFEYQDMLLEFPKPEKENFYTEDFTIEHIPNPQELREWGRRQHNCVASYVREIINGKTLIFRITAPEEATLSIIPKQGGGWEIGELLSIRNSFVSEITKIYVEYWLNGDIQGEGCPLKNFPLPETQIGSLHLKPLNSYKELLQLHFNKYKFIQQKHIFQEHSLFIYKILAPEKGIAGVMKINGVWEAVLLEDHEGHDLSDKTRRLIEQWLWDNTPDGKVRQAKFDFPETIRLNTVSNYNSIAV